MRWVFQSKQDTATVDALAQALGVDSMLATLLVQRGVTDFESAKQFFRPKIEDLHDPFLMKDMQKAVDRIEAAVKDNVPIMVFGDYDVDGTTAVALVTSYLQTLGAQITPYVPDRYAEGYGISLQGIDKAVAEQIPLIIALDCGVKAIDQVAYAKEKGIDFIICDHHQPGNKIPDATAVLNPKQKDCSYPYKELCGCGVGFKLIQALTIHRGGTAVELASYLDLVVTAIGADIVPITGENRVLAYLGLQVINENPRPGIQALGASLKKKEWTISDVVFVIAPRINAAGRMKHGAYAVEILLEKNVESVQNQATAIETYNSNRKELDRSITQEALTQLDELKEENRMTTVVYQKDWHKGVIGIVASRLIETHYRPTVVFTQSGDVLAASARSVKGFDLYKALEACSEHLLQFGGHKYAAGMTLLPDQYEHFKAKFEQVVSETIEPDMLIQQVAIDCELSLDQITSKFYRILKQFAPFGPGNMTPVFATHNVVDTGYAKRVGKDETHLRITAVQEKGKPITGIGFGLGDRLPLVANQSIFSMAYSIDENEWNNRVSLQLKLKDIQ